MGLGVTRGLHIAVKEQGTEVAIGQWCGDFWRSALSLPELSELSCGRGSQGAGGMTVGQRHGHHPAPLPVSSKHAVFSFCFAEWEDVAQVRGR